MAERKLGSEANAQWARVRGVLRSEVGEASYTSWLKPLTLVSIADGIIRISVPTRFMRDWVESHYGDRIRELWADQNDAIEQVEIFVRSGAPRNMVDRTPARALRPSLAGVGSGVASERGTGRAQMSEGWQAAEGFMEISQPLDERFKFEHFIVGNPNELAYAAARRVAAAAPMPRLAPGTRTTRPSNRLYIPMTVIRPHSPAPNGGP